MKNKEATFIKQLEGWMGDARLYELKPPIKVMPNYEGDFGGIVKYVVVSAVIVPLTGAETLIFPADKDGEVLAWRELNGSFRGGLSHQEALGNAGYGKVNNEHID